jgi:hypothetical protein
MYRYKQQEVEDLDDELPTTFETFFVICMQILNACHYKFLFHHFAMHISQLGKSKTIFSHVRKSNQMRQR